MQVKVIIAEGAALLVAARPWRTTRPPVVARARRGMIDLGDFDAPGRRERLPAEDVPAPTRGLPSGWVVPVTAALVAAAGARAAMVLF